MIVCIMCGYAYIFSFNNHAMILNSFFGEIDIYVIKRKSCKSFQVFFSLNNLFRNTAVTKLVHIYAAYIRETQPP